jgi:hypothetical protein
MDSCRTCSSNANAFAAEIVVAESNAAKVSNKLMEMFEQLADKPTKETYEQATAMVSMLILL